LEIDILIFLCGLCDLCGEILLEVLFQGLQGGHELVNFVGLNRIEGMQFFPLNPGEDSREIYVSPAEGKVFVSLTMVIVEMDFHKARAKNLDPFHEGNFGKKMAVSRIHAVPQQGRIDRIQKSL
jgi:hypothetical protein